MHRDAGGETASARGNRLRLIPATALAIERRRRGRGFEYVDEQGCRIRDEATLARIRALAIPPAYRDVRIATDPRAHLQATGRDALGRIQHRYHADWERVREGRKLKRLRRLIEALPDLRAAVRRDMASRRVCRDKALACAVAIIDRCHLRVGNETYAKTNGSYGASTLLKRHVEVSGRRVAFRFRGKSGRLIAGIEDDAALARALGRLMTLPGRRLLQYRREDGSVAPVRAGDVNAYLRRVGGLPISSKDLRMLAANAAAAERLLACEEAAGGADRRHHLADVMRTVSEQLANTPAVVRKSYVHEIVVRAYASGRLRRAYAKARPRAGCSRIERTLALLSEADRRDCPPARTQPASGCIERR